MNAVPEPMTALEFWTTETVPVLYQGIEFLQKKLRLRPAIWRREMGDGLIGPGCKGKAVHHDAAASVIDSKSAAATGTVVVAVHRERIEGYVLTYPEALVDTP